MTFLCHILSITTTPRATRTNQQKCPPGRGYKIGRDVKNRMKRTTYRDLAAVSHAGYSIVKTADVTSLEPLGGAWQSKLGIEPRQ